MALALIQAAEWKSKRPEKYVIEGGYVAYTDAYLLNTNRMSELKVINTDNTQFLYSQAPNDRRCSLDVVESTNSIAVITSYADLAEISKFATLDIFPAYDITATPVSTVIEWDDICMIYQTPKDWVDNVAHMVYYKEAWKRTACMIDHTILQVLALEYV